ncbi:MULTISPECIES: hypothetical protein [unclassified Microcoleus]|uniref:hypothetical protein n=1 Tax=unclassified Microcoleus TaxID=2642155 RepID=UPI002FD4CC08
MPNNNYEYHKLPIQNLEKYRFYIGRDLSYGYDRKGVIWQEPELTEMRKKGAIFKEYPYKVIVSEKALLGAIQECLDGSWLASTSYFEPPLEILGFINQFYAVRFMHQVIKVQYPQAVGDVPSLPSEPEKTDLPLKNAINSTPDSLEDYTFTLTQELDCEYDREGLVVPEPEVAEMRRKGLIITADSRQCVFFENILLGYLQECLDGTWLAHSPYNPFGLGDTAVFGFINKFYGVRYLHQVVKVQYPDEIGDFIYLPWEDKELEGYGTIGNNIASRGFKLALSDLQLIVD